MRTKNQIVEQKAYLCLIKINNLGGENTRVALKSQESVECSNAIAFDHNQSLCKPPSLVFRANVPPPPLTVASIVVNRGETMLEPSAAAASSSTLSLDEEEDEAADHNRGGERAADEDRGENRVESMNKLLVLCPCFGVAEVAILIVIAAALTAGVRPRSFALRRSPCGRPLGGRRRRRFCRRRRRCAKASVILRPKKMESRGAQNFYLIGAVVAGVGVVVIVVVIEVVVVASVVASVVISSVVVASVVIASVVVDGLKRQD